jgi:hypothetical protein
MLRSTNTSIKAMFGHNPSQGMTIKPLPSPMRVQGNVFMPEDFWHDTINFKVEIVSLFSHREGEAMVHTHPRKYECGMG